MSRPPAASTNGTRGLVSSAAPVSSGFSSATDTHALPRSAIGGNGTVLLAGLVAVFAVAVTAVVGAAGIRSSRRRY
jgi:hypothetical protein